jgi:hypothetical protein
MVCPSSLLKPQVNLVDEIDPSFLVVNASKMNMKKIIKTKINKITTK